MRRNTLSPRAGFTLVEMLVATALVVLIMFMFAQVFQMATQAMSQQKSMAELDQGARTITTVLANDLHNRTFRDVMPFWPGQITTTGTGPNYQSDRRKGYFYVSENDPANGIDDVLQLTIDVSNPEASGTPFARGDNNPNRDPSARDPFLTGKAAHLGEPSPDPDPANPTLNQPEFDDGIQAANESGLSQYAEVSYFLRNGNLYRRVLLIRNPYDDAWSPAQEGNTTPYSNGTEHFWRDFDYSAWYTDETGNQGPVFNTFEQLENSSAQMVSPAGYPLSLGVPHFRFGHTVHRNPMPPGNVGTGLPREFLNYTDPASPTDWPVGNATEFIGRFTLQECSHSQFGYPGRIPVDNSTATPTRENPMDPATPLTYDDRLNVSEYADQTLRRGDDLLMTNVHEFDVKVWDDTATPPGFYDLGHGGAGYYGTPDTTAEYGNRFDTWHPTLALARPPYFPSTVPGSSTLAVGAITERPLRGIQVKVRYQDVRSGSMRQITRNFSLVDPGQ